MPRTLILTAHTVDYQAVRVHLTELEEETHSQGTVYEVGQFSVNGQTWEVGATQRIQGIESYGMTPDELLAEIGQRIEAAVNSGSSSLTDERHKRIDHA